MKLRALVSALVLGCIVQAQERAPNIESITKEELRADLTFLASDAMQGRLTDTVTNAVAAEFVASRFQRLGLTPAGPKGSYFQPYNLMTASIGATNALTIAGGAAARSGQDFYPARFSAAGTAKGAVVFAGFGITWPSAATTITAAT